jgi:hypothetical protein
VTGIVVHLEGELAGTAVIGQIGNGGGQLELLLGAIDPGQQGNRIDPEAGGEGSADSRSRITVPPSIR